MVSHLLYTDFGPLVEVPDPSQKPRDILRRCFSNAASLHDYGGRQLKNKGFHPSILYALVLHREL